METPFKMKGFSGFGNSPVKKTKPSPVKNGDGPTDAYRHGPTGTGRKIPKKNTYQ